MATTFTKLRDGSWGLRIEGSARPGDSIQVSKKDGTSEAKTVGSVVWQGNGITLATIAGDSAGGKPSGERRCKECRVRESSLRAPYEKILRNGLCSGCNSDRRAGYGD